MFGRKKYLRFEDRSYIGVQFCFKPIMLNARLTINIKARVATERFLLSGITKEMEAPYYWYQVFNLYSCSFRLFRDTASLPQHRI